MRVYLFMLLLSAGCATERPPVRLITADEKQCGKTATDFIVARYPNVELDDVGVPKFSSTLSAGYERYLQWAVVADRCLKQRGAY